MARRDIGVQGEKALGLGVFEGLDMRFFRFWDVRLIVLQITANLYTYVDIYIYIYAKCICIKAYMHTILFVYVRAYAFV